MARKAKKKAAPKRRPAAKKAAKKPLKKRVVRTVAKKAVRKAATKPRPSGTKARPAPRHGTITHTELASTNPLATRDWCTKVLGWKFGPSMPTPGGPYHMWQFDNGTGGGIRANNPPEAPGAIPYCEVPNIHAIFAKSLAAGAAEMLAPMALEGGMGWIAIVAAPGGVAIGFWAAS